MTSDDTEICREAENLIDRAHRCEDNDACESLTRQAYNLLKPLIESNVPAALYLHACYTLSCEALDEPGHERRHIDLIKKAAQAGYAKAQFALGQMYEPDAELPVDAQASAFWFEQSALQGYAYAQWVHGLNLLIGIGVPRDEGRGLEFIRLAAEGGFDEAMKFVADAYASGTHGYPLDKRKSDEWHRRLLEPGATGL